MIAQMAISPKTDLRPESCFTCDIRGNTMRCLAEATIKEGSTTASHCHKESEEIYVVVSGRGHMSRDH
jgi:mannose-6-phosphate isomerase-like protein (cupin superfamily)